jgi:hypothetical protein
MVIPLIELCIYLFPDGGIVLIIRSIPAGSLSNKARINANHGFQGFSDFPECDLSG